MDACVQFHDGGEQFRFDMSGLTAEPDQLFRKRRLFAVRSPDQEAFHFHAERAELRWAERKPMGVFHWIPFARAASRASFMRSARSFSPASRSALISRRRVSVSGSMASDRW